MTNGQLTKKILSAAKTQTGDELLRTAKGLMRIWPLSSNHLLYDGDKSKVSPEAWDTLIAAAVETDKAKLDQVNAIRTEAGLKPDKFFGRYKAKKGGR